VPDNSILENNVPVRRPPRFRQFSMRTLLVLVALAAAGCLLVRNEMAREERREKLIAELEAKGATWQFFYPTGAATISPLPRLWRQPMAAWLRGKPMVPPRSWAMFGKGTSLEQIREFLDLFPSVRVIEIDGDDTSKEVLRLLAVRGPFDEFRIKNPLVIDKEKARQIAQVNCKGGVWIIRQECSDEALLNLAEAGVKVELYFGDDFWRNVSDEGLKTVAMFPKTRAAHANCRGTDAGVQALAGHPSLAKFFLTGPLYSDASADVIPTLKSLSQLHIAGTSHTDAGLARAIAGCNARSIELIEVAVGDQTIEALALAPNLTNLTLSGVELSAEQCDALAKLPLGSLTLSSKGLTDDRAVRLAPLARSLRDLDLKTPQVTDAGLTWLSRAKSLTMLRLDDTQATAATWSTVPLPSALKAIGMGGPNFDIETMVRATNTIALNQLALTGSEIEDATLDHLPPGLSTVLLVDTRVTPEGLNKLARTKGITSILVFRESDVPALITEEDVKEVQKAVGPGVELLYDEASRYRCE
jgi:hypothetical protein